MVIKILKSFTSGQKIVYTICLFSIIAIIFVGCKGILDNNQKPIISAKKTQKTEFIYPQNKKLSVSEITTLFPTAINFGNTRNIILAYFDEKLEISERNISGVNKLYQGIGFSIDDGATFYCVKDAELSQTEDGKSLISIILKNEVNADVLVSKCKVRFSRYLLKSIQKVAGVNGTKELYNKTIKKWAVSNGAVLTDYEFISGDVFNSNGGKVRVKVTGLNFGNGTGFYCKIKKNEQPFEENGIIDRTEITDKQIKDTHDGSKIIIFDVPPNHSKLTENYTIYIRTKTTDPWITPSASMLNTYDNKRTGLVVAVLPDGKRLEDQTLGFIHIHCYDTQRPHVSGTSIPDVTYVIPPIKQESKKTFLHVYGSNLKKELTKVRMKDKNGVYWTPIHDTAQDSGHHFIMTNYDLTGIRGSGNLQFIEVICPRGFKGDQEYEYQIALDGKNYDTKVLAHVKILDDSENMKLDFDKKLVENIKVHHKYKDNYSEVDEVQKIKGYTFMQLFEAGAIPLEKEGYKCTNTELKDEYIGKGITEFTFEYKKQ